jgi:hypothetical protein
MIGELAGFQVAESGVLPAPIMVNAPRFDRLSWITDRNELLDVLASRNLALPVNLGNMRG